MLIESPPRAAGSLRGAFRSVSRLPDATLRLGGVWGSQELKTRLKRTLAENLALDEYRVEHDFVRLGRKAFLLRARRIELAGRPAMTPLGIKPAEAGQRSTAAR